MWQRVGAARALTSKLSPLPDPRAATRAVYDAVAGFGPLQRHLGALEVEEIWINERVTGGSEQPDRATGPHARLPRRQ